MNIKKFFALAAEAGISECQIQISRNKSLSMEVFRSEMESYQLTESISVKACGIYNGKMGSCSSNRIDNKVFDFLINGILTSAKLSEKPEEVSLFKGSEKYHKKNVYSPALANYPIEKKIALLYRVEKALLEADPRISEVEGVNYYENENQSSFYNSHGLRLSQKSNYYSFYAGAVGKQGEEVKTAFDGEIGDDPAKINEEKIVNTIVHDVVAQFGAGQCKAGKYPTVIDREVFDSFINILVGATSADSVQRKSSFLCGKLHEKIASKKVTIMEKPLDKNVYFTYFDDEGVATYNKNIVKNGVLETYLYNRETAKKDGVETTGNGYWSGSKIGTNTGAIFMKNGKKSLEEMIAPIKEGVYIKRIAGLGTGLNANSGNFSCQAGGFMIRDGKLAEPLTLITLSGNVLDMFRDVKEIDNKGEFLPGGTYCPDVYIKSMAIGGK